MSLENLEKIGQLKPHPLDAEEIDRLLTAAVRNLRDARTTTISMDTSRVAVLDTLRRKRNVSDYTGDDVDE